MIARNVRNLTRQRKNLTITANGSVQNFVVPFGVSRVVYQANAARGGTAGAQAGGRGDNVIGTLITTPYETLYCYGGTQAPDGANGGANGTGGPGAGAPGGGSTQVRQGSDTKASASFIAGAGGGASSTAGGENGGASALDTEGTGQSAASAGTNGSVGQRGGGGGGGGWRGGIGGPSNTRGNGGTSGYVTTKHTVAPTLTPAFNTSTTGSLLLQYFTRGNGT